MTTASRVMTGISFAALLSKVKRGSEGENSKPVRIFTSRMAPVQTHVSCAGCRASGTTAYQAGDATTINKVFQAVVSNF
ncbi:MAG: hypothetical protein R2735_00935 [Microthrixaceae bacterium]